MLILTRKPGESLYIGDDVKVTIIEIKGHQIRVGIDAPKEYRIYREEIYQAIMEENRQAAETKGSEIDGLAGFSRVWSGVAKKGPRAGGGGDSGDRDGGSEDGNDDGETGGERAGVHVAAFSTLRTGRVKAPAPEVVVRRRKAKSSDE